MASDFPVVFFNQLFPGKTQQWMPHQIIPGAAVPPTAATSVVIVPPRGFAVQLLS